MDINNLIAFIEVAEKKSFSRSAETLKLTQPAVSKRVAALETELSAKLFDRVGRAIHLTEAGRILLPSARQITTEMSRIENVITNLDGEINGTLRIGTTEYIGTHLLPEILKSFRKSYPNVEFDLKFSNSKRILQALESGTVELALCSPPEKDLRALGSKLTNDLIWNNDLVIVASPEHPLANNNNVTLENLASYPAILPPENSITYRLLNAVFKKNKQVINVSMQVTDIQTIRTMTAIGIGWGCLHSLLVDDTLTIIDVDGLKLKQPVTLIRHAERTLSNSARAFIELLPSKIEAISPA